MPNIDLKKEISGSPICGFKPAWEQKSPSTRSKYGLSI